MIKKWNKLLLNSRVINDRQVYVGKRRWDRKKVRNGTKFKHITRITKCMALAVRIFILFIQINQFKTNIYNFVNTCKFLPKRFLFSFFSFYWNQKNIRCYVVCAPVFPWYCAWSLIQYHVKSSSRTQNYCLKIEIKQIYKNNYNFIVQSETI